MLTPPAPDSTGTSSQEWSASGVATLPDLAASVFLKLPAELILHCLEYLSPKDLVTVAATCRTLSKAAAVDGLWQRHVNANLHFPLISPQPLPSFKALYCAHHPYWFLTRNQIWISDQDPCGKLVIARYNQSTGAIEAHTVVAERGLQTQQRWEQDSDVMIIGFEPQVKLHLEAPVLRLNADSPMIESSQEVLMDCSTPNSPGLHNAFVLSRDYPNHLLTSGSAVWPSMSIPAPTRTRNLSASDFTSLAHRPSSFSEVSQSTFRVRKWVEYHGRRSSSTVSRSEAMDRLAAVAGMNIFAQMTGAIPRGLFTDRRGDRVTTFGTIDPEAYTPTPRKPWRGIYCGDYSGHGCEFLLVLQIDEADADPLPKGLNWLMEWLTGGRRMEEGRNDLAARTYTRMNEILTDMEARDGLRRRTGEGQDDDDDDDMDDDDDWEEPEGVTGDLARLTGVDSVDPEEVYTGRLVALKLTGDPHVPRGEISFIAPDLGPKGYHRTAEEDIFRGARVVRSAGHVANRGFIHDEYIPSELILVSHDQLAQYWKGFGHVSFYKRVDIDALLAHNW
ncbi:hypothetical protein K461DRAFT_224660 [Myriangium duriaei CBS 260.36]|uniref:F-box domain-containing protein n=1 Tax=Myriangium duriaei CBS 260.36 TaxID=1168546 RepID=A0A9P4MHI7_9PEZI|nr:hypothetical protein K461DRAFT_224660 [Myriangium duriaei CBS 260.36]